MEITKIIYSFTKVLHAFDVLNTLSVTPCQLFNWYKISCSVCPILESDSSYHVHRFTHNYTLSPSSTLYKSYSPSSAWVGLMCVSLLCSSKVEIQLRKTCSPSRKRHSRKFGGCRKKMQSKESRTGKKFLKSGGTKL